MSSLLGKLLMKFLPLRDRILHPAPCMMMIPMLRRMSCLGKKLDYRRQTARRTCAICNSVADLKICLSPYVLPGRI